MKRICSGRAGEVSALPLPPYVTLGSCSLLLVLLPVKEESCVPNFRPFHCSSISPPGGARGGGLDITNEGGGLVRQEVETND